jgi:SAM-dependent methyltransferase
MMTAGRALAGNRCPVANKFPYSSAGYHEVPCNLCKRTDVVPLGGRDRNRLPVRTVICKHCGFIYISPRMTPEWYGRYYATEYRQQMARYYRTQAYFRPDPLYQSQLKYGRWVAEYLKRNGIEHVSSILDIGSSTGGLLQVLGEKFAAEVTGVEPSPEEGEFARRNGVRTVTGLFEDIDFNQEGQVDLITCTLTFNHLLDPHLVVEKVRRLLKPGGLFYVDCIDFFSFCEYQGAFFNAVQIDHVSMFVPATLQAMCEVVGLEVLPGSLHCDRFQSAQDLAKQRAAGIPFLHVRLLANPGVPKAPPQSFQAIRAELDRLQLSPLRTFLRLKTRPATHLFSGLHGRIQRRAAALIHKA